MPPSLNDKLSLWCPRSVEQLRRLVKRRNELAQHCIHHLGVDGVVGRPLAVVVAGVLEDNRGLPGLGGLGHIDHNLTGHLVQLVIGRNRFKRSDLLLILGGEVLDDLVHRLACDRDLGGRDALVLVDRHVADLVVKALEIGLGILLGIDTQLLELVARSLLQTREEVVATVLDLVKLRRKILGDELLNRRTSATGKHDHACNQDGHEGRKQQLLFHVVPPNERHRASRTRRTL